MPGHFPHASRSRTGQSTVEYMLVIAVISLGLLAATLGFSGGLQDGLEAMTGDVQTMASEGYVGGGR
ncbi:MAG: hypothetical protein ABIO70_06930 [Pseudomonadota bacterium]